MQQQPTGLVIGQKGVKYGLQKPAGARAPAAPAAAGRPKPAAALFGDSDSDEDIGSQVARQAAKKASDAKVQAMHAAALQQDASVFDYDGVYDAMQAAREAPKAAEKVQRQSRYIASLKEQAERRKREEEIAFERRTLKEQAKEDHLYEGKERFVTSAYRKKLEEDAKWKAEEAAREEAEAKADVRKVGHMGNFYANLLSKNVAYGGATASAAGAAGAEGGAAGSSRTAEQESAAAAAAAEREKDKAAAEKAAQLEKLDTYERLRLEAELARRAAQAAGVEPSAPGGSAELEGGEAEGGQQRAGSSPAVPPAATRREPLSSDQADRRGGQSRAEDIGGGAAGVSGGKRRNEGDAVAAARERYLARKRQNVGS